ncbi:hypothetical protein QFC22_001171 [Naganishia vaughanmartiniae]|uniref:Uncharacterized protein n=1 Tax=Naganishia vaughanmartiniae TaxID=1424756 RepID=A0ACC2XL58_9TREE|nr:hypothetical protein QFC22_001171 [Naganishia vaughanmartiniae]
MSATEPAERIKSTPLLEYLKEQRMGKRGSGMNDTITKTLHGNKATDKDAVRSRKEREKERVDKKKNGAIGGKQGGGNRNEKATTGPSSNLHAAAPGQIKIAKRPTADTGPDIKSQNKGGVALPDLGKRSEVKIQLKQGGANEPNKAGAQNLNAGGPNVNKGKPVKANNNTNLNNQKLARTDGPKGEKPANEKKRDTNDRPGQTSQQPKKETEPAGAGQGRRPRPAVNLLGGRNLLTAALKSSTRDTSASPAGNPATAGPAGKGGRNRDRAVKAGGASPVATSSPVPAKDIAGGGGNSTGGNEGGAAGEGKARRPPRSRGGRGKGGAGAGGEAKPDVVQAGAGTARIDA